MAEGKVCDNTVEPMHASKVNRVTLTIVADDGSATTWKAHLCDRCIKRHPGIVRAVGRQFHRKPTRGNVRRIPGIRWGRYQVADQEEDLAGAA